MQITVINLPEHAARWAAAARQFEAVGLEPVRFEAVEGAGLAPGAVAEVYSERLNRCTYHKPLRAGEIGCYLSHIAAWRWLLQSGADAMAIFEDDIEIDADLPAVLDALSRARDRADVVKLIGREREKVASRTALSGGRDVITYRRVPSLTAAYVLTARGAQKLLANRLPFGRPVDVDMRHWWECDLEVRGVHPYPVRGAASGDESTIGDRRAARSQRHRWLRLQQQAHYTLMNWLALDRKRQAGAASPPGQAAAVPALSVRRGHGAPRRRNLVVLRAGDSSLHREWLSGDSRDFDLLISYYGDTPGRHREDADLYEARRGPKWPGIAALLAQHPQLLDSYEAFWFPDDDLSVDGASLDRMFAFFCAYRLCMAQPALTRDSFHTWDTLLQDERCHIRYTRFVEVMAPLFSRAALQVCVPTFAESRSGWGLDWLWPRLCAEAKLGRIAVLDATPVRHTRPVGGELYANHPDMRPREEAARLLRRHGVEEVRATAKYSFEGRVKDVGLPIAQRLVFWLKRMNGRRKHRLHA